MTDRRAGAKGAGGAMRALSLWQPWASAIALGAKRVETRSWSTAYRGLVAIHAAKRCRPWELIEFSSSWTWCAVLAPLGKKMGDCKRLERLLPFGAVVAVADLVDVRPTGSFTGEQLDTPRSHECSTGQLPAELRSWTERTMGDYSLGRYGWVLENVRPLIEPIPMRGFQGLWNLDADVTAGILRRVGTPVPA